ncbi:MAG: hypothetical protein HUU38_16560 [Anaerolineales bacterium]|nr:hypothetical protein [Anaerolineales bacterium]
MYAPDPLLPPEIDERPPPHPLLTAFKRVVWTIITLLVILSLLLSLILPLFQRREPRRNPENEIQAHWISNEWSTFSVQ